MTNRKLEGRVALITGTGGGQGREAALQFARAGAKVVGCDVKTEGNLETARMVKEQGGEITTMQPVDLSDPNQARAWVDEGVRAYGKIDIVYNNASAARFVPIEAMSVEDWSFTIRNELDLVFLVTRFAWPHLQRNGGVLINVASVGGIAGSGPGGAAHAAAKGGVIALTRHLAFEGAPFGIRTVCLSPGVVESPGTAALLADPQMTEALLARNLIKRAGKPADIAALALFLASDEAGYITGENIVIDGGRIAW